jgi:hypothetical protein
MLLIDQHFINNAFFSSVTLMSALIKFVHLITTSVGNNSKINAKRDFSSK